MLITLTFYIEYDILNVEKRGGIGPLWLWPKGHRKVTNESFFDNDGDVGDTGSYGDSNR